MIASKCAVVIVNYNNHLDTLNCLRCICQLSVLPMHVAVVDNGSDHQDLTSLYAGWKRILEDFKLPTCEIYSFRSEVTRVARFFLLRVDVNLGFSGGNNAAIKLLLGDSAADKCEAFWILNNDTLPSRYALDELCQRLSSSLGGICGSTLVYAAEPHYVQTAGGAKFSPLTGATSFICAGENISAIQRISSKSVERAICYMVAASMLVDRKVFLKIGLFAEEYFLYYEDTDFGIRARRAGFSLVWAPNSIVYHKEGATTKATVDKASGKTRNLTMDLLSIRNRFYVIARYYPWCLPIAFASLCGVFWRRLQRGQGNRIVLLFRAALNGATAKESEMLAQAEQSKYF